MRYVTLEGKRWAMRDIHRIYKEQRDALRRERQMVLFELKEDSRPQSQRCADGRYSEPLLFRE
jgi:hypothetical protein